MIIWSIVWGAVLGWFWPGYGDAGVFLGGFLGLFAGLSLRWAVRAEVEASRKKHLTQAKPAPASPSQPAARSEPVQITEDDGGFKEFETTHPLPMAPLPAQRAPAALPKAMAPASARAMSAASNEEVPPQEDLASNGLPQRQAAPVTRPAFKPAEPNAIELALIAGKNWFLGGNTIVRVGLVILFIGLSFLARYAASAGLFPV
ncbi:MAG: DUF2339 domain-containing protein, partial [Polaromonas sp.]